MTTNPDIEAAWEEELDALILWNDPEEEKAAKDIIRDILASREGK
jgi:hypothetical protein